MKETVLTRLADRFILAPTRHAIRVEGKSRRLLRYGEGQLEVWTHRTGRRDTHHPDLYVLKFPGTRSRAERLTDLLASSWTHLAAEVWAVNPPGYGGSSGRASLHNIPWMADLALDSLSKVARDRPVVVAGNSLGCVSALYLAANRNVNGLLLKNPPALREVVNAHPAWWHLKLGAALIARQIPEALNSIHNAARVTIPAVFAVSVKDRLVPARIQQRIIDAYAGPKRVLSLSEAGHSTPLTETESAQLAELTDWLYTAATAKDDSSGI